MGMTDFHSHILPGIDDGSRNLEDTRLLLRQAKIQGLCNILATPHFYADRDSVDHFLAKRAAAMEALRGLEEREGPFPEIRAAAEVYYFPGMGNASMIPRLCMEGSNLLLLEMPFAQWTDSMYRDVEALVSKRGLTVLLVHVERFYDLQRDKSVWEAIFRLPVYAQINTGSLLRFRRRSFGLKFLKEGHPVVLGSDCHRPDSRPVNIAAGREVIRKKLGDTVLDQIDRRGEVLWEI